MEVQQYPLTFGSEGAHRAEELTEDVTHYFYRTLIWTKEEAGRSVHRAARARRSECAARRRLVTSENWRSLS
jgi:hypothetical protein